jgi:hypothetical protein
MAAKRACNTFTQQDAVTGETLPASQRPRHEEDASQRPRHEEDAATRGAQDEIPNAHQSQAAASGPAGVDTPHYSQDSANTENSVEFMGANGLSSLSQDLGADDIAAVVAEASLTEELQNSTAKTMRMLAAMMTWDSARIQLLMNEHCPPEFAHTVDDSMNRIMTTCSIIQLWMERLCVAKQARDLSELTQIADQVQERYMRLFRNRDL